MHFQLLQIFIILVFPYLLTKFTKRLGTEGFLSPVVLCYVVGIGLRNLTPMPLDIGITDLFIKGTIVLAIPLLLYSTDLIGWFKLAKSTVISFFLVMVSVIISSAAMAFVFWEKLDDAWILSGMLAGIYIGGTPNLNAVGISLDATSETIATLNVAEIACGGIYLLFLTSVAHRFFGLFLPEFQGDKHLESENDLGGKIVWKDVLLAFGLTILLAGAAAGLTLLFTGALKSEGIIILLISAFSVAASFSPKIRAWQGAFEMGDYLLLMFCIAIGMRADFSEIFFSGGWYIALAATTLLLGTAIHVLLCRIFNIDRDTMMITQTAGFYGPPFIGQIAAVIKNRSLLFSGIATGLVGLAAGNFIGVAVAKLVRQWLQ